MASCITDKQTTTTQAAADINKKDYQSALSLLEEGKYEESKALFEKLGDYKDSAEYLSKFCYLPAMIYNDIIGKGGSICKELSRPIYFLPFLLYNLTNR